MLDQNNINALHLAMDMDVIKNSLCQHWSLLKTADIKLVDCQLIRVYPLKEGHFLLHYETTLETQESISSQQLWGELLGGKATEYYENLKLGLRKSRRTQLNKENRDAQVFCVAELGIVFRIAGLDERLLGLKLLHKPRLLKPIISEALQLDGKIKNLNVELLGHRLGKRCIARVNYQQIRSKNKEKIQTSLITKSYKKRTERSKEVFQLMNQLGDCGYYQGDIRIPKALAYVDEWNMILMEDVSGVLITEQADDKKLASLQQTAQALAEFHQTQLAMDNFFTTDDEISLLENWVRLTALVFPSERLSLYSALDQISCELGNIKNLELTLVHRDFYEKQVLLDGAKTTLIDFDTCCLSDPAIDVGNYLAHLVLLRLQGIKIPSNADDIFLSAYTHEPFSDFYKRVNIYKRSTLLRLLCLYSFWPQWRERVTNGLLNTFFSN